MASVKCSYEVTVLWVKADGDVEGAVEHIDAERALDARDAAVRVVVKRKGWDPSFTYRTSVVELVTCGNCNGSGYKREVVM